MYVLDPELHQKSLSQNKTYIWSVTFYIWQTISLENSQADWLVTRQAEWNYSALLVAGMGIIIKF